MIQNYSELKQNIHELNINWSGRAQIQKIFSSSRYVSLSLRLPGKTAIVYLGRGKGYEGVWLGQTQIPSKLRQRDRFLEFLRKHLENRKVLTWINDDLDRAIKIEMDTGVIIIFWEGRNMYFGCDLLEDGKRLLFFNWKKNKQNNEAKISFEDFNELGRKPLEKREVGKAVSLESLINDELQDLQKLNKKEISKKKSLTKIKKIQGDLDKISELIKMKEYVINSDEMDLGQIDWKKFRIKRNAEMNMFQFKNLIFQKIKNYSKAYELLNKRIQQAKNSQEVDENRSEVKLKIVEVKFSSEITKPIENVSRDAENEYEILKREKWSIAIGLSDRGNDQIRNTWASNHDMWVHLDQRKSAHAIIKMNISGTIDHEAYEEAANLIAKKSGANLDWIPIVFTQVGNVKSIKGSPGLVTFKKEKRIIIKNKN